MFYPVLVPKVCEVEQCRPEVYPLAMNCLDRFLSVRPVRKCQLQLTGAVCMLLASKFRQTKPLSLERLSMFTDYSVTREELKTLIRTHVARSHATKFSAEEIHFIEKECLRESGTNVGNAAAEKGRGWYAIVYVRAEASRPHLRTSRRRCRRHRNQDLV
ncbi:hypothetical protein HPB51_012401 [Rhipicephalus microplus]|uniref:Cyclin-like domain-containing protein n=1 Tax=Rhipicephalus microplus TaxID=6941 RepID=A0A9J6EA27_RHIMP|nr:hypothetical protein HPB51_012401 [Rhipicephalus microplus]